MFESIYEGTTVKIPNEFNENGEYFMRIPVILLLINRLLKKFLRIWEPNFWGIFKLLFKKFMEQFCKESKKNNFLMQLLKKNIQKKLVENSQRNLCKNFWNCGRYSKKILGKCKDKFWNMILIFKKSLKTFMTESINNSWMKKILNSIMAICPSKSI